MQRRRNLLPLRRQQRELQRALGRLAEVAADAHRRTVVHSRCVHRAGVGQVAVHGFPQVHGAVVVRVAAYIAEHCQPALRAHVHVGNQPGGSWHAAHAQHPAFHARAACEAVPALQVQRAHTAEHQGTGALHGRQHLLLVLGEADDAVHGRVGAGIEGRRRRGRCRCGGGGPAVRVPPPLEQAASSPAAKAGASGGMRGDMAGLPREDGCRPGGAAPPPRAPAVLPGTLARYCADPPAAPLSAAGTAPAIGTGEKR